MKGAPPGFVGRGRCRTGRLLGGVLGLTELAPAHGQHPHAVHRATALGERPGGRVVVAGGGVDADAVAAGLGQRGPDAGEDVGGALLLHDHERVAALAGHAAVTGDALDAGVVVAVEEAVLVQPLGPLAVLGRGVREGPRAEVGEAGPELDLGVERDDAAAARPQDQHLRRGRGDLAVGGVVEHGAGLDPAVEGQVVDVAVGIGGRVLAVTGVGAGGVGGVGASVAGAVGGVGAVVAGGVGGLVGGGG